MLALDIILPPFTDFSLLFIKLVISSSLDVVKRHTYWKTILTSYPQCKVYLWFMAPDQMNT